MSDQFIGEIQAFPFPFATGGFNGAWLPCFGQLASIQRYSALFALIGVTYGGNGTTTFALPNLNGAVAISQGTGPGLQPRIIGDTVGSATVNLTSDQMAAHRHVLQLGNRSAENAAAGPGTSSNMAAIDPTFNGFVAPPGALTFSANAVTMTGQGLPHDNMQPTQALIWCIAYAGSFPTFTS